MNNLYYASGALYGTFADGKREYFYENGILKTVELYREGKLESAELYWPNGTLKRRCFFNQGIREGLDEMWNDQGILLDQGTYEQGKAVGIHRRWAERATQPRNPGSSGPGQRELSDSVAEPNGSAHLRSGESPAFEAGVLQNGQLIEEIVYLDATRFDLRRWDELGVLRVEALWEGDAYREKSWDRFQNCWIEKKGHWDGKKLVYR